jgi:hypothetical protein
MVIDLWADGRRIVVLATDQKQCKHSYVSRSTEKLQKVIMWTIREKTGDHMFCNRLLNYQRHGDQIIMNDLIFMMRLRT